MEESPNPQPAAEDVPAPPAVQRPRKRGRSHGWARKRPDHHKDRVKSEGAERAQTGAGDEANVPSEQQIEPDHGSVKLTVTLPPLASLQQPPAEEAATEPVYTGNERFCYCNGLAYGEVSTAFPAC